MKSCSRYRKEIAVLAPGALDNGKSARLREHLGRCESCRRYRDEMANVTQRLAWGAPRSDIEASEFFHRRVDEKLHATQSRTGLPTPSLRDLILSLRVVVPTTAFVVVGLFVVLAPWRHASAPSRPTAAAAVGVSAVAAELQPSVANYQVIARQSLEKLDEVLTKQANQQLPPVAAILAE